MPSPFGDSFASAVTGKTLVNIFIPIKSASYLYWPVNCLCYGKGRVV